MTNEVIWDCFINYNSFIVYDNSGWAIVFISTYKVRWHFTLTWLFPATRISMLLFISIHLHSCMHLEVNPTNNYKRQFISGSSRNFSWQIAGSIDQLTNKAAIFFQITITTFTLKLATLCFLFNFQFYKRLTFAIIFFK